MPPPNSTTPIGLANAGPRHFCTYFDHHYLPRGLALYYSLRRYCPAFHLWVLCLSPACYRQLQRRALPGLELIALEELERADPRLHEAKGNRSLIEYYFTLSPVLPLWLFQQLPELGQLTYLDSDLFFFSRLDPLWQEIGQHSIAITSHRFAPALQDREKFGLYNVGWLTFRRDANGLDCLQWWRDRCLEWCYDRYEPTRFADQKYLEAWPERFAGVVVLQHPGANLAPWNVANHRLSLAGEEVRVEGQPLIFFHFHGLKQLSAHVYDPQWSSYHVTPCSILRNRLYTPYLQCVAQTVPLEDTALTPALTGHSVSPLRAMALGTERLSWTQRLKRRWKIGRGVLTRKYLWLRK